MHLSLRWIAGPLALVWFLAAPEPAQAYIGPGLGAGAISVALGIVGSLLLGIVSVVWYPIKRLFRRMRAGRDADHPDPRDNR